MPPALQIPLQIRFGDVDSYGHVNNVTFATYLEDARVQLLHQPLGEDAAPGISPDLTLADLVGPDNFTLVGRHEIEYLAPLHFRTSPIHIAIWITDVGGSSFEYSYTVGEEDGSTLYAHASSGMVLVNRQSGRPIRLSPELRFALERRRGEPIPFRRRPQPADRRRSRYAATPGPTQASE